MQWSLGRGRRKQADTEIRAVSYENTWLLGCVYSHSWPGLWCLPFLPFLSRVSDFLCPSKFLSCLLHIYFLSLYPHTGPLFAKSSYLKEMVTRLCSPQPLAILFSKDLLKLQQNFPQPKGSMCPSNCFHFVPCCSWTVPSPPWQSDIVLSRMPSVVYIFMVPLEKESHTLFQTTITNEKAAPWEALCWKGWRKKPICGGERPGGRVRAQRTESPWGGKLEGAAGWPALLWIPYPQSQRSQSFCASDRNVLVGYFGS